MQSYRPSDKALPGRGRNQAPVSHAQLQRDTRNNGLFTVPQELTSSSERRNELSQAEYLVLRNGKSGLSDHHQSQLAMWESMRPNSFSNSSGKLECVSSCPKTWLSPLQEAVRHSESGTPHTWESALSPVTMDVQPLPHINHER